MKSLLASALGVMVFVVIAGLVAGHVDAARSIGNAYHQKDHGCFA